MVKKKQFVIAIYELGNNGNESVSMNKLKNNGFTLAEIERGINYCLDNRLIDEVMGSFDSSYELMLNLKGRLHAEVLIERRNKHNQNKEGKI